MMDTKHARRALRKKHRHAVLTEMVRQKTQSSYQRGTLDWEKIRAVAEPYSKETAEMARIIGLQDAGEPIPKSLNKSKKSSVLDNDKDKKSSKKKGELFGLFKKK
jgi:hypothetical protein